MHVELTTQIPRPFRRGDSTAPPAVIYAAILAAVLSVPVQASAQTAVTADAPAEGASVPKDDAAESRLHFSIGADYTTAYFFRGFAYEDTGLIIQPWADFSLDIVRTDGATVSLTIGTWNSFHGQATDASTSDDFRKYWFESDVSAGVSLELDRWSVAAVYNWYTSPSDAFETTEEVMLTLAYEDEDVLPCGWTLLPELLLAIETGSVANDGFRKGSFLQLGISPGVEFDAAAIEGLDLRFPLRVGLSLSNYYEGENGENDVFGYASAGAELTVPLPLDSSWGEWSLHAGIHGLFLGDVTTDVNGGDDFQLIANIGISVDF